MSIPLRAGSLALKLLMIRPLVGHCQFAEPGAGEEAFFFATVSVCRLVLAFGVLMAVVVVLAEPWLFVADAPLADVAACFLLGSVNKSLFLLVGGKRNC
jgi:hypothetical protein